MMILITYDVETISLEGARRLRRVAKECQNYGQRVQNSVFECVLTEAQFALLRNKITSIIDEEKDSVRFYYLGKTGTIEWSLLERRHHTMSLRN